MLTIAGADTGVAAVIGINVAAIAADEARSTIIVDTGLANVAGRRGTANPRRARAGRRHGPAHRLGRGNVASHGWRDRVIDVLPSGITQAARNTGEVTGTVSA